MLLRNVQPSDTLGLYGYLNSLSSESKSRFGPHSYDEQTVAAITDGVYQDIEGYVVEDSSQIIAYATIKKGFMPAEKFRFENYGVNLDDQVTYSFAPSVADKYQNKGIGSFLLKEILVNALPIGTSQLVLWGGVQALNQPAVNFYKKHGFSLLGEFEYMGMNYDMIKYL